MFSLDKCISADVYTVVHIKTKVVSKTENKQSVIKNDKKIYKCDCIIADNTGSMELVVWQELIDNIHAGESYHFKNLTIRIFDDEKYLNTNESTTVEKFEDLSDIILNKIDDLKESIIKGRCIALQITKKRSCPICNGTIIDQYESDKNDDDELFYLH